MTLLHSKYSFSFLVSASLLLSACGGSSSDSNAKVAEYSGKTTPASFSAFTPEQQKAVVNDTHETLEMALSAQDVDSLAPFPIALDVTSSTLSPRKRQAAINTVIAAAQRATNEGVLNLPVGSDSSLSGPCKTSGSTTIKITGDENSGSMSLTWNNCREDDKGEYTITNGKASLSYKANSFEMTFDNFKTVEHYEGETSTVVISGYYKVTGADWASSTLNANRTEEWHFYGTDNGKSFSASGSLECKDDKCVYSSVVKDAKGKVYRVSDLVIKNAYQDEYQLTAKVYHPDHGHYRVTINSEWGCERSEPSPFVGTATLTSENGTITYQSTSCSAAPTITLSN